jgi:transposase
MDPDRLVIKKFFDCGFSTARICQEVKALGINRMKVYRTVRRLKETGSIKDRPRSGRPRTVRTRERKKRIREKIRRNPRRSARKLASEEGVSDRSMRRLLRDDLHLFPYKKRSLHGLSANQKIARLQRATALLERHDDESVKKIIFSDEKVFTVEEKFNAQNDRIYALAIEDIPEQLRTVQRFQKSNSVMVWAGVGHKGKLPLKFVDPGAKINARYYQEEILETTLKPNAASIYPDGQWVFRQDSAPAHKAKTTQAWLNGNCPSFISSQEWPPSSPDSNSLDFCIWGMLEAVVNAHPHRSIEGLKRKLIAEWDRLSMKQVRAAIDCWLTRLALVVKQKGGRFE